MEHKEDLSFKNQKIINVEMSGEVKKSFIEYSMSVITSRALPDVRDGMKPGARRILYAMYEDGLVHSKPFRKSATTVGNVLGRYHPHGDAAVYGTMVRMAQDFSMRYPLVEGHGNFGSVDGDGAAAYRYTEARLDRIADEMMRDKICCKIKRKADLNQDFFGCKLSTLGSFCIGFLFLRSYSSSTYSLTIYKALRYRPERRI